MGSSPDSFRFLLQELQCRPHTIRWFPPRPVVLRRGHNHKLGFHFKTYAFGDSLETVTVVVLVKKDCRITEGALHVCDRIVRIGAVDVRQLQEQAVRDVFTQSQEAAVQLQVSAMSRSDPSSTSQIKRILSINSGASGSSLTSSVDSGERPQRKRFQKSDSTEAPPSPPYPTPPPPPDSPPPPPSSSPATAAGEASAPYTGYLSQRVAAAASGCSGGGVGGVVVEEAPPTRRLQHCPPRGCASCSRPPQGYLFRSLPHHLLLPSNNNNSSNSSPPQHIHSLPDRMMDGGGGGGGGDIVLPDDIVLCEADEDDDDDRPSPASFSSLPPVLTPLPNMPTPSSFTQSQGSSGGGGGGGGAYVNTVSTGIGGGGGGAGAVEACRAPGCSMMQRGCLWHNFVHRYPQHVVWEPSTRTVQLQKKPKQQEKGQAASFGFKYKVKKYDGPQAEVFALVVEVAPGGVAWGQLLAGDWIRSINGTPVNTPEEAFFGTDFRNVSSLRLVIQRPQRLMQRGVPKLRSLAATLGISIPIPLAPGPAHNAVAASPPPPPPRQQQQRWPHPAPDSVSTYQIPRDVDRVSAEEEEEVRGRVRVRAREQNVFDPLLECYPCGARSLGEEEHIPLNPLNPLSRPHPLPPSPLPQVLTRSLSTVSDRCPLPQARVVVCGAHGSAADFARGLLLAEGGCVGSGSGSVVDLVDPEAPVQSFQLSLQCGDGGGGGDHPRGGTCTRSQRTCLATLMKEWGQWECSGSGGTGGSAGASRSRWMNVELYVINDEEFLHHCCPWLLPSASLLVLTFHANKLLNQPQAETRRLANMTHTLQACTHSSGTATASSSPSTQILLYGVPSGCQRDVSAEEVQVMFYVTDAGSRLLQRQGLIVDVAVPTCPESMGAVGRTIVAACEGSLSRGPPCMGRVVDALCGMPGVRVTGGDVYCMVCRALGGNCGGDPGAVTVQSVVGCLIDAGCLLPYGSSRSSGSSRRPSREAADQQSFLLPFQVFQALSSLLGKRQLDTHSTDSRQKWFRLISTGRVSRSELVELLAAESSPLTVEVLEQLGIVVTLPPPSSMGSRGDSGFAEDARGGELLVPYFLQDVCRSQDEEVEEERREGEGFVLRLERPVSWWRYYEMLRRLSTLPGTEEVRVLGRCRAVVRHNGTRLALHWTVESGTNSLFVAVSRPPAGEQWGEKWVVQDLEHLFSCVMPPALPFTLQATDSSSPSSHLPSREPHAAHAHAHTATAPVRAVHSPPCMDALQEETYVKAVAEAEECSSQEGGGAGPYSHLPLSVLPWSVLKQAALLLTVAMPTGHDWRSVADQAGKTMVEICAYEAIPLQLPALSFLQEWITTGKVQQFLDILERLDRPDVRDLILDFLENRKDAS